MPDRPTCKDCRFWDGNRQYGGQGKCMKNAPVIGRTSGGINFPAWPHTDADQWCGEHKFSYDAEDIKIRATHRLRQEHDA